MLVLTVALPETLLKCVFDHLDKTVAVLTDIPLQINIILIFRDVSVSISSIQIVAGPD